MVCDAIATKFVRDDFTGYATCLEESLEKSLEESFRCIGVSSLLSVDVDNFVILIDGALRGALKVMLFAGYLDKYLAQETGIA